MKLYVLYGQRKCSYSGEYAPEALTCIDENGESDNPDYLVEQKAEYEASGEFDSLAVVEMDFDGQVVEDALAPKAAKVQAKVKKAGD
jgi:hypothetical protein